MRRAGAISSAAHVRAMRSAAPGQARVRDRGRAAARVPAQRRARPRLRLDRGRRRQRLRAALPRERRGAAQGRAAADRRGLRARQLRLRHHAHLPRRRRASAPVQRTSTSWCSPRRRPAIQRGEAGADFIDYHDAATRRAGAGADRLQALQGQRRRGARGRLVQAVLHAPHRPLAGPGRARRGRLHAQGQVAQVEARHGAHGRARPLHPPRAQRARRRSGTSACASRTTCSSPRRAARSSRAALPEDA